MINTMKNITLAVHPLLLHLHDNRVVKPDVIQITTVVDAQQRDIQCSGDTTKPPSIRVYRAVPRKDRHSFIRATINQ